MGADMVKKKVEERERHTCSPVEVDGGINPSHNDYTTAVGVRPLQTST